jgi:hypothetical protein
VIANFPDRQSTQPLTNKLTAIAPVLLVLATVQAITVLVMAAIALVVGM